MSLAHTWEVGCKLGRVQVFVCVYMLTCRSGCGCVCMCRGAVNQLQHMLMTPAAHHTHSHALTGEKSTSLPVYFGSSVSTVV